MLCIYIYDNIYTSSLLSIPTPGYFTHISTGITTPIAHALKSCYMLYLELSTVEVEVPAGILKVLLDPGGGFRSERAVYVNVSELKRLQIYTATVIYIYATAIPQRTRVSVRVWRLCSGVGIFTWYYLSSPSQIPRGPWVGLERKGLIYMLYNMIYMIRRSY